MSTVLSPKELLFPSVLHTHWILFYLSHGLGCDMPVLEAFYLTNQHLRFTREQAIHMLSIVQYRILWVLEQVLLGKSSHGDDFTPPEPTADDLVPLGDAVDLMHTGGMTISSTVLEEPTAQDVVLQFAMFGVQKLMVEKYALTISPTGGYALLSFISEENGVYEYVRQCTWTEQLHEFSQLMVRRVFSGEAFVSQRDNYLIQIDFLHVFNEAKSALAEHIAAQPPSLWKAKNQRQFARLQTVILQHFQETGENYTDIMHRLPDIMHQLPGAQWTPQQSQFLVQKVFPSLQQQESERPKLCSACEALGQFKHCARCKLVYYCSARCQTLHWKIHQTDCRSHPNFFSLLE